MKQGEMWRKQDGKLNVIFPVQQQGSGKGQSLIEKGVKTVKVSAHLLPAHCHAPVQHQWIHADSLSKLTQFTLVITELIM